MNQCFVNLIPGWAVSGVVEEVASDVKCFKAGDEIYGRPDLSRNGAYAEYIVIREKELALKPKSLDHIHAAAIPLSALTAWQALFDSADLQRGQRVLIHAAAGGAGHYAVQLARWKKAHVFGTASKQNHDFLRRLDADEVVDYKAQRFEEVFHNMDVVFDTIGGETQQRSWRCLRKGGIFVSILSPPSPDEAMKHDARAGFVFVQSNAAELAEIAKLMEAGKLKAVVETVLPLREARHAQELSRSGHTRGKIVLQVT